MLSRRSALTGLTALPLVAALPRPSFATPELKIRDIYVGGGEFSPEAQSLVGEEVIIPGFMAPPLKPDAAFFVLTRRPMAVCPFCDNEADWPRDIVLVKLDGAIEWLPFNVAIAARGVLELGTEIDEDTGFVSRVRLVEAEVAVV
ncbi:MAG: hypothetical protein R3F55_26040 [Alphaproteobacteria bacterium]